MIEKLIDELETEAYELLMVGAVEPAERKQTIADLLKELKEYRNGNTEIMQSKNS